MIEDVREVIRSEVTKAAAQVADAERSGRDQRDIVIDQLAATLGAIRSIVDVALESIRLIREGSLSDDPDVCRHPGAIRVDTMTSGPRRVLCPVCGEVDL